MWVKEADFFESGKCNVISNFKHSKNLLAHHDGGCQQVPGDIPGLFVHEVRKMAVLKDTFPHLTFDKAARNHEV